MMVRIILNLLRVVRLFARLNSKCGGHARGRLPPPLLNPAPSAIAFDIVFREAFREVERVVLNSLLSTRAIGASISATERSKQRRRNSGTSSRLAGPI